MARSQHWHGDVGASAPLKELQKKFGFTPENVVASCEAPDGRGAVSLLNVLVTQKLYWHGHEGVIQSGGARFRLAIANDAVDQLRVQLIDARRKMRKPSDRGS